MLASQTPFIDRLIPELVLLIFDILPFESHFDFARASRHIHQCALPVLQQHQQAHRRYRVVSDLDPLTVPRLADAAVQGALQAWHVRSLEIWHERWTWDDWREAPRSRVSSNSTEESPSVKSGHEPGQANKYLDVLREELHVPERNITQIWDGGFAVGNDTLFKILLIALSPRLETVKIVRGNGLRDERSRLLSELTQAIAACRKAARGWPPGFANLKNVEIGIASGTESDQSVGEDPKVSSADVMTSIIRLPKIHSLYFHYFGAYPDEDDEEDEVSEEGEEEDDDDEILLPRGSSTLQHLFIDGDPCVEVDDWDALLGCPAALKSLSVRGNEDCSEFDHTDQIAEFVCKYQPSLETFMMYHPDGLHGYRCTVFRPDEDNVKGHMKLRHLSVNVADWVTGAYYWPDGDWKKQATNEGMAAEQQDCVAAAADALPESLELLVVNGQRRQLRRLQENEADAVEACLAHLIISGTSPKLRTIIVQEPDVVQQEWGHSWERLVEIGREHGVEVWVRCNSYPKMHPVDLPRPPHPGQLESAQSDGDGEMTEWKFNVFLGCMQRSER